MQIRNKLTVLILKVYIISAIRRKDMFPYGTLNRDLTLHEGDDRISRIPDLKLPMYFYGSRFSSLYVATNGVISTQVPPLESQYVNSGFPLAFPVIAPFLADLDTSQGRGTIYYRVEDTWCILQRVAKEVRSGFPEAQFMPSHAAIITWEDVASYEEVTTHYSASSMLNTFQVVLAYNETESYALFLYPEGGLQFFGTRPKNPYSTGLEIPARVGFSRGGVPAFTVSRGEELYYSVANTERSLKDLYQQGNAGCPGVWIFHIGSRFSFQNVVPATAPASQESSSVDFSRMDCAEKLAYNPQHEDFSVSSSHPHLLSKVLPPLLPEFLRQELFISSRGVREPKVHLSGHGGKSALHLPSDTFSGDEDLDSGSGEIKEMCAWSQFHCSQDGYCMDYPTGRCCHCQSGFYGNGQQCLAEGLPQRVSGKVSGLVFVGDTPVKLASVDLHAYVMVVDGRIHAAISRIPEPVGWALLPVVPTGAVFGWLFALEQYDHQNGFSITGAEFTCHTEVIFYPGNKHLTIVQEARDLDPHGYLSMDTLIYGDIPSLPPGTMVKIKPYKEIYHYHSSAATSRSMREYTVLSPEGGSETFSYQIQQNVTFRHCPHGPWTSPEIQQLSTELVMVLYEETERALRYMMLSKVGPVEELQLVNPCVSENHNCHSEALCLPGQGLRFHCRCPLGYHGDGHSCHDLDECKEGLSDCGDHSVCVNAPGGHHCQCHSGFEFRFDKQACVDVDECLSQPCHPRATCSNYPGSFECRCHPGFEGDGIACLQQQRDSAGWIMQLLWCLLGVPAVRSEGRQETACGRQRDKPTAQNGDQGSSHGYLPQCDSPAQFSPVQCHRSSCWCVDGESQEIIGTRTQDSVTPPCIDTVAPPTERHQPRPTMTLPLASPAILYTQGHHIGIVPLDGPRMNKESASSLLWLQGSIVVGIGYDCQEGIVYWTDLAKRTISRARLEPGVQPEVLISTGLVAPEGLAVDAVRGMMVWVDSGADRIETSGLDGRGRRAMFRDGLVNPRAIVVDSSGGSMYWSDWNPEAPKIESCTVEGQLRKVLVHDGIQLPNALTFDDSARQLCWADAGTKMLECIASNGTGRRQLQRTLNYPFALAVHAGHFYWTDWLRDGILAMDPNSSQSPDEYLPDQRHRPYGITVVSPHCLSGRSRDGVPQPFASGWGQ
ncbi:nidogen-2 isoform X2 [Paramormyrops kingsleyae]|uniref:nidogen-2 isoform X2 n=1 Tax=Paramormyrops kingsleyae TaxID=1676925 RepID=UPI003B97B1B0